MLKNYISLFRESNSLQISLNSSRWKISFSRTREMKYHRIYIYVLYRIQIIPNENIFDAVDRSNFYEINSDERFLFRWNIQPRKIGPLRVNWSTQVREEVPYTSAYFQLGIIPIIIQLITFPDRSLAGNRGIIIHDRILSNLRQLDRLRG